MRTSERGFIAWMKRIFSRPQNPLVVIMEQEMPEGDSSAIASLAHHPGFLALMHKLRLQQKVLEAKLLSARHSEIRDVDSLQLGIAWSKFMERQIADATKSFRTYVPREASASETEEFQRIRSFIETVGNTTSEK